MNRRSLLALFAAATFVTVAAPAFADPPTVVHAQFTDRVERGRPVGDAAAASSARAATYWVELNNPGAPTQLTFVWVVNGREVQRQTMDIGRGSHWRTWVTRRVRRAQSIEVRVLDAAGTQIHSDTLAAPSHT